jgi:nucleoside 2-deoxyribosyltransferase
MTMNRCYIASGWFSPEWLEELENIKTTLDSLNLGYFSPKDENLCSPDSTVNFQDEVFNGNIRGMEECDWMLCNTRNKDMGSIFEAGYFHKLGKPIVYFCAGLPPGVQFNLMLAASGEAVCTSLEDLQVYLQRCIDEGNTVLERRYQGKIE